MRNRSTHPSDELLHKAIDGDLAETQSAIVERHVVDCDACRRRTEQMAPGGGPDRSAPIVNASLRARLRANLARLAAELDEAPPPKLPRLDAALAVAALVVIAVSAAALRSPIDSVSGAAALMSPAGNALPVRLWTPGAVHSTTAAELCAGRRPAEGPVSPPVRLAVLRDYQMEAVPAREYELDFLITPELGGAATRQNLWPERYASRVWNARVKDQLEVLLPRLVCEGRLELATAQRDIAADWIAAYKKYFHTDQPLALRLGGTDDDDLAGDTPQPLLVLAQLSQR
jgi:hypothetical protein